MARLRKNERRCYIGEAPYWIIRLVAEVTHLNMRWRAPWAKHRVEATSMDNFIVRTTSERSERVERVTAWQAGSGLPPKELVCSRKP